MSALSTDQWILLVEDEEAVQVILSRYLRNLGFAPCVAANGQRAFDILASRSDSGLVAIFVDGQMPVMDGSQFLEELSRRRPALLRKTIWISGCNLAEPTGRAAASVPKPLWPKTISEALAKIGALIPAA
ncbi:MAG: response regulator [Verrucomicrobia bacterium]|nr:response regulator [Verrucomicrobiota bacterium]